MILCISGWRGEDISKTGEKDENLALFQTLCRILLNMARWGSRQLEGRIGGRGGSQWRFWAVFLRVQGPCGHQGGGIPPGWGALKLSFPSGTGKKN